MCRIAGCILPEVQKDFALQAVGKMCNIMQHGGPDDEGIYSDASGRVVLGNRRLSLLDLSSAGHQPMHYEDQYTITYNGELYNHLALKEELRSLGKSFSNHTDTEVILAAFSQWNTGAFSRLNGMFAFALHDRRAESLYLVRDPAGIKPLYYSSLSSSSESLVFSSEMKGFAPFDELHETHDAAAICLLAYGHLPEPVTTLKKIRPLPKGCFLKYNIQAATHSLQSFQFFSFSNKMCDKHEIQELVRNKMQDAVNRQMIADAPAGIFLSGGLDSSVLACLADKYAAKGLNTLSIYFNEEKYSEKKYQDEVAAALDADHHAYLLEEKEFHGSFSSILRAMDMPSSDGINTWFISKYARELGLKAVLSGIGGDELFGGYPSFRRMRAAQALRQLPNSLLRAGKMSTSKKLTRADYLRIEGVKGLYLFLRGYFMPREIAERLGCSEKQVWLTLNEVPAIQNINGLGPANTAAWMEFNLYMQNQLLRDADVMSMAHGVEIRVPFLDDEVARLLFSVDEKLKFGGAQPKQLLIDCFKDLIPSSVWNRKKMGFSFPFSEWLKNSEEVKALGETKNKHIQLSVKKFFKDELHWSRIMSLIVLNKKLFAAC